MTRPSRKGWLGYNPAARALQGPLGASLAGPLGGSAINNRRATVKRRTARDNYLRIVDYLGGRCADCKRVFPIYVYDVHCPDETRKDFSFADIPKLKPFDEIKDHLDNCVLLCCSCHRIRHHDTKTVRN